MSKRLLADVLWEAANRLSPVRTIGGENQFTCTTVARVELGSFDLPRQWEEKSEGVQFMRKLGCPEVAVSNPAWQDFDGDVIQGVRYMWLLLAMHVAEDEGLTV